MKRSVVILVAAVVVTTILIVRFQAAQHSRASASVPPVSLNFTGQQAPDFALESLDGRTVRLSDFRGKVVVLNFWATWCQPCKIEMPWFEQLQKQYGEQGVQVIGVAMDDPTTDAGKTDIANFARNLGVDYPVLLGTEDVGEAYGGVQFLPATFYLDRDGKVVDKVFGLKGRAELEDNIKKALAKSE